MGADLCRCSVALAVAFLAYAAVSLIWTPFLDDGILEIAYFSVFAGAVILGATLDNLRCVFLAAAFGIGANSLFAIVQWMGWNPVIQLTPRPSGLFLNANILSETSALILVGLFVHSATLLRSHPFVWWLAALCMAPSLLLPMHRGSMIALGIAGTIWLIQTWRSLSKLRNALLLALLLSMSLVLVVIKTPLSAPVLSGSIAERLTIWHAALDGLTWFGHGAGSFRGLFAIYAAPYTDTLNLSALHAHNDLLELAFNYGIFAALPLAGVAYFLIVSSSPFRLVVLVFLVEGCFEFPLFMPATGFLAALAFGSCIRDRFKLRLNQHGGGMALFAGDHKPR